MKTLRDYFLHHKFRLAVFALLDGATIICMILVRVRFSEDPATRSSYAFLIQNLFLAWVPFVIALIANSFVLSRKLTYIVLPICCLIWLVFFPNAPYLLTDFQHLRLYSDNPSIWFDVIMVIWFVFTGLILGLVSLYLMHRLVQQGFGKIACWMFVIAAALLSSAGIYVGRFLRLRSWEVFLYPSQLASALLQQRATVVNPIEYISLYTLFIVFIYLLIYTFGNLLQEDAREW
jgi:uncharacterized membrane protein